MEGPPPRSLIVLAEDNGELRRLLATGLEHVGFEVIAAENGARLLECVREVATSRGEPSLIITDVRMPGLDGLAAIRSLRDAGIETPVIFVTAFGDVRARDEMMKLNSRWIDKPVGLHALRAVVAEVLGLAEPP